MNRIHRFVCFLFHSTTTIKFCCTLSPTTATTPTFSHLNQYRYGSRHHQPPPSGSTTSSRSSNKQKFTSKNNNCRFPLLLLLLPSRSSSSYSSLSSSSFLRGCVTHESKKCTRKAAFLARMNGDGNNGNSYPSGSGSCSSTMIVPLTDYLLDRTRRMLRNTKNHDDSQYHHHNIVIGNEAGDADSIISSIAYAYIHDCLIVPSLPDHHDTVTKNNNNNQHLLLTPHQRNLLYPICPISDIDLQTQRPETVLLLKLAGTTELNDHLIFINNYCHSVVFPTPCDGHATTDNTTMTSDTSPTTTTTVNVTLVDHNRFNRDRFELYWKNHQRKWNDAIDFNVAMIIDHHMDEQYHIETTASTTTTNRIIAYENNVALVASTCTLIVELLQQHWKNMDGNTTTNIKQVPASVSLLLLGVILLDSINMDINAGKVTDRDVNAIQFLLQYTDWEQDTSLPHATKQLLLDSTMPATTSDCAANVNDNEIDANKMQQTTQQQQPNTTLLFETLQNAKFAPEFWQSLSIRDAVRLDYKLFTTTTTANNNNNIDENENALQQQFRFGISTVLMSYHDFVTKHDFVSNGDDSSTRRIVDSFLLDMQIEFLGIMLAHTNNHQQQQQGDTTKNSLIRELVFVGRNVPMIDEMIDYLLYTDNNSLQLLEMSDRNILVHSNNNQHQHNSTLFIRSFQQNNYAASRKQVAPLLLKFFQERQRAAFEQ